MKPTPWNPAEFAHDFELKDVPTRRRIWDSLQSHQQRLYEEWKLFGNFAQASLLGAPRDNAVTLDPDSCSPPAPDIACNVNGDYRYFELGEIVMPTLARALGEAERDHEKVVAMALDIWRPLEYILEKKCSKLYCADASPLILLGHKR